MEPTSTTYILTADDLGSPIGVEVTATGVGGSGTADSNLVGPVVAQAPPSVVTLPSVTGDTIVGSTVDRRSGHLERSGRHLHVRLAALSRQREGSCTTIEAADGKNYVLTRDDVGFRIGVSVTATNAGEAAVPTRVWSAPWSRRLGRRLSRFPR